MKSCRVCTRTGDITVISDAEISTQPVAASASKAPNLTMHQYPPRPVAWQLCHCVQVRRIRPQSATSPRSTARLMA